MNSNPKTAEFTSLQSQSDHDLRVPCYCEENAWRLVHRHLHGPNTDNRSTRRNNDNEETTSDEWNEDDYHVVFVSNENRCCPFFRQRALPNNPREYVCWDYHVFVIRSRRVTIDGDGQATTTTSTTAARKSTNKTEVLDIDTWLLPYPCPIDNYLAGSFPHANNPDLDPKYLPFFRVIPARNYLKYFYSDRMHMFKMGKWSSPPPEYDTIMNGQMYDDVEADEKDEENESDKNISNLEMYIDMSEDIHNGGNNTKRYQSNHQVDRRRGIVYSLAEFRSRFA
mmetsp:Transcript_9680/g.20986  ORF Transcript_9680/g.20986 Transcript_9680/m.20986 type:complete len:281 (-) Transcript_9680:21-863(-)